MQRRVAITGLGLVTPLATGVEETWSKALAGQSGIGRIQKWDPTGYKTQIAGEVLDFVPEDWMPKKQVKRLDVFIHYAVGAARMALRMAGLPDPLDDARALRAGCILGVGLGGISTLEENILLVDKKGPDARISPFFIPKLIGNMASGEIAMQMNLKSSNLCLATACAAGSHGVGESYRLIKHGLADTMICGGAEAVITPTTLSGFNAARALSTRNDEPEKASRPFEKNRDGFIMAEGSGILILEEMEAALERGAKVLGEVIGYGITCDAYHMTAPAPDGDGFVRCMQMALDDAGVSGDQVQYINAHGTSTDLNDATETLAIKRVFGDHAHKLAVSSTKSMHGHMLGATGGVEAALTTLAMRDQVIPPTINYDEPDPDCDLDYVPNVKREAHIDIAMSNSFGFGGTNATLLFKRFNS